MTIVYDKAGTHQHGVPYRRQGYVLSTASNVCVIVVVVIVVVATTTTTTTTTVVVIVTLMMMTERK